MDMESDNKENDVSAGNAVKPKVIVRHEQIYDSATRLQTALGLLRSMGLSDDDVSILLFHILGNTPAKDVNLPDILRHITLPRIPATYDREKLKKYIAMLASELRALDKDYGVLTMETHEVIRASKNKKYITVYGAALLPITYRNLVRLLENNPDYVISVMLGIYESLKTALKFLGVLKD